MVERMSVAVRFFATRSLGRLLLASLTIVAILLGLVGMHAVSVGAGVQHSHATHSQISSGLDTGTQMMSGSNDNAPPAIASALGTSIGVVSAQRGTDMWAMNCLLLGMVCALSLLFALIGLVLSKFPSPPLSGVRRVMRLPRIDASVLVLPTTPSLHTLSISRT